MTLPNTRHYAPTRSIEPSPPPSEGATTAKEYEEATADAMLNPLSLQEDMAAAAAHLETDATWHAIATAFLYPSAAAAPVARRHHPPVRPPGDMTAKLEFAAQATALLEYAPHDAAALASRYDEAIHHLFDAVPRAAPPPTTTTPPSKKSKKRTNLSSEAKRVLRAWFDAHFHHPYPTEEEKERLRRAGGITMDQVNNWFINTRVREWKPKLHQILADNDKGDSAQLDEMLVKVKAPYQEFL
ncbi:Aste57867_13860 [Aphanomyces stellatus]|uniref:Aste57867_13860 protein n=1 Tax=Aphanomyces stellatus TaxID=120398 RepID=A0A485KZ81_9STRA|nr:hypothetical protein As57867_013809 [Aphanomyces stellatus]VFT90691.1 Aste57867_13860 [Aphanomyces stellatus]